MRCSTSQNGRVHGLRSGLLSLFRTDRVQKKEKREKGGSMGMCVIVALDLTVLP